MTITDTLNAIGNVVVGTGGGASAAYPVIGFSSTEKVVGTAGTNLASYRETTWNLRCLAFAATSADIATLNETLRTDLARRGERVTLTEWATARTLAEGGIADGSLPGYPEIEISPVETDSVGPMQAFGLRATTRIPIPAVDDLVEHDYTRTEEIAADGDTSIRQSGTLRVANGENARTYAQANVIDAEETAAGLAGQAFAIKWTTGIDAAVVGYELSRIDKDGSLPGDVVEAQVTDETTTNVEGRIARTISGWARGTGAATYVAGLKPTPTTTNILTRNRVSDPTVPDGRINFTYELLEGAVDVGYPGMVLVNFSQNIVVRAGGAQIAAATYYDALPILRRTEQLPWVYVERTVVGFVGSWTGLDVPLLMDEENLVSAGEVDFGASGGVKTATYTRVYMYAEEQTTPEPYELEALT